MKHIPLLATLSKQITLGALVFVNMLWPSNLRSEPSSESSANLSLEIRATDIPIPGEFEVKMDPRVCGTKRRPKTVVINEKTQGLRDVVIWLEGPNLPNWPKDQDNSDLPEAEITIHNCEYEPRIVVVRPGALVRFTNKDGIHHKVRSAAVRNKDFNRPLPPQQKFLDLRFSEVEIVPLRSEIHPWMHAFVVVAPHPSYQHTDSSGKAVFKKIPYGTYRLMAWHEVLGEKVLSPSLVLDRPQLKVDFQWSPVQQ